MEYFKHTGYKGKGHKHIQIAYQASQANPQSVSVGTAITFPAFTA